MIFGQTALAAAAGDFYRLLVYPADQDAQVPF